MKYISSILLFIITTEGIYCHVTNSQKNVGPSDVPTTQVPTEKETQRVVTKEFNGVKHGSKYTAKEEEENRVYLDDVLFTLKNHNWTAEEKPCLDQVNRLLHSLQNFTLWAVWAWDSQASEPQGLLYGNRYQLGNFDQCMDPPWSKSHLDLKMKYCLADIVLERTDKAVRHRVDGPYPYQSALDFIEYRPPHSRSLNEITWGACVPRACPPRTVEKLLGVMLSRSHLGAAGIRANISISEECQNSDEQNEYDVLFYAFFGVFGTLLLITLICTYLTCRQRELNPNSTMTLAIKAFCLKENAQNLLRMNDGLEVFYGIRFLSICLIVVDHQMGISNSGPISNGISTDVAMRSTIGTLIMHDDLLVDTFFLLSGFLTITGLSKFKTMPNALVLILRRYVRLAVAFAVVMFFMAAVFPYTGSGPLWKRSGIIESAHCRKNWWLNLLMVSNYIDPENMCLVVSWYIPCDFHCSVVAILLYCIYRKFPRLGVTITALLAAASIILPGVVNYVYQLQAVQLFTNEFLINPRGSRDFQLTYIKSHTRFAAYLVGIFCGYVFFVCSNKGKKIKQKWSILGTCSAIAVMLAVMVFGSMFLWRRYDPLEGAIYAALNRPVWALGVGVIVLCCSLGHVPIVKPLLAWFPWVPLSRLAYGLYLTHTALITRNVFITRNPQHNDFFDIANTSAGVIFWGCVAALIIWLFAEAPLNNLFGLCLTPKSKHTTRKLSSTAASSPNASLDTIATTSKSQLHENLPNTLYYSSKI